MLSELQVGVENSLLPCSHIGSKMPKLARCCCESSDSEILSLCQSVSSSETGSEMEREPYITLVS